MPLNKVINLKKMWKRIYKSFLFITLFTGLVLVSIGNEPLQLIKDCLHNGGFGPGSYYVWIFLQFSFLLPLSLKFITKWSNYTVLLFIIISQLLEWLCIIIDIPESIYRLLCFRYIFLIYMGYIWTFTKISQTLNVRQVFISIISLSILLILYYSSDPLEPWFRDSNWRICHWVSYFYAALLLPWILRKIFNILPIKIRTYISIIGKSSYEIFLVQMLIFAVYPKHTISFGNDYIDYIVYFTTTLLFSILIGIIWNNYRIKSEKS